MPVWRTSSSPSPRASAAAVGAAMRGQLGQLGELAAAAGDCPRAWTWAR